MARTRRSKKRVFSERQRDAIIRLAQAPIETKNHTVNLSWSAWLSNSSYLAPSVSHSFRYNFLQPIPRETSTPVGGGPTGSASFVGDELQLRGLRIEFNIYGVAAGDGLMSDMQFRFTVYRQNTYNPGVSQILPGSEEIQPEGSTIATWWKWDPDGIDILYQRKFRMDANGSRTSILSKKFWVRMNRKCVTQDADFPGALFESFGEKKDGNLYWALETFAPGNTNLSTDYTGNLTSTVYFKDA